MENHYLLKNQEVHGDINIIVDLNQISQVFRCLCHHLIFFAS